MGKMDGQWNSSAPSPSQCPTHCGAGEVAVFARGSMLDFASGAGVGGSDKQMRYYKQAQSE
jgi:hypothetical protein